MKKKSKKNVKKSIQSKLDKVTRKLDEGKPGNPFSGIKFTDEERLYLAHCGIV